MLHPCWGEAQGGGVVRPMTPVTYRCKNSRVYIPAVARCRRSHAMLPPVKTRYATEPTQLEEAKGTSALPAPEPAAPASATPKFEAVPIGKWEPVAAPAPAPPDAPREGGKGGGRGTAAVAAEQGSSTTGVFGVGARVEVLSADKWYPAVSVYC